jgi:hypothetical protein
MGSILTATGTLLTAIGMGAAVMQLRANGRQARDQFEESLTARYRQLVAELPVWAFFELQEMSPSRVTKYSTSRLCPTSRLCRRSIATSTYATNKPCMKRADSMRGLGGSGWMESGAMSGVQRSHMLGESLNQALVKTSAS